MTFGRQARESGDGYFVANSFEKIKKIYLVFLCSGAGRVIVLGKG